MRFNLKLLNRYKSSLILILIMLLMLWYVGIRPEVRISELQKNGKQVT